MLICGDTPVEVAFPIATQHSFEMKDTQFMMNVFVGNHVMCASTFTLELTMLYNIRFMYIDIILTTETVPMYTKNVRVLSSFCQLLGL